MGQDFLDFQIDCPYLKVELTKYLFVVFCSKKILFNSLFYDDIPASVYYNSVMVIINQVFLVSMDNP
mgnify:CR=1 FL=1